MRKSTPLSFNCDKAFHPIDSQDRIEAIEFQMELIRVTCLLASRCRPRRKKILEGLSYGADIVLVDVEVRDKANGASPGDQDASFFQEGREVVEGVIGYSDVHHVRLNECQIDIELFYI